MDQLKADSSKVLLHRNTIGYHWVFVSLQLEWTNSGLPVFL